MTKFTRLLVFAERDCYQPDYMIVPDTMNDADALDYGRKLVDAEYRKAGVIADVSDEDGALLFHFGDVEDWRTSVQLQHASHIEIEEVTPHA